MAAALSCALIGCSSSSPASTASSASTGDTTGRATSAAPTSSTTLAGASSAPTVWLCRPGAPGDPCEASRAATSEAADGSLTVLPKAASAAAATAKSFDCFYVYPTVSQEQTANADLAIQPLEIGAAVSQASRFSQVCNVWAPMYRQRTQHDLDVAGLGGDVAAQKVAYDSLLAGWDDFLAHDDDGRPIILIGHSQGAAILIQLLANVIDPDPALRTRLVSAIILGGNVEVPPGRSVGGSFRHIPPCTATGQTGCVIAYSSFAAEPPADSLFGRPGQGVSLQSYQPAKTGRTVVCTNPAALAGGSASLQPYFSAHGLRSGTRSITTRWVTYPGLYQARCEQSGGASWLQITATRTAGDPRPVVRASLGPTWGLHVDDASLALGNLVADVAAQERAYHP